MQIPFSYAQEVTMSAYPRFPATLLLATFGAFAAPAVAAEVLEVYTTPSTTYYTPYDTPPATYYYTPTIAEVYEAPPVRVVARA
jgi:hypothetical protein